MKNRIIKNTNIEIAPINFGGNVFGWTLDEKGSFKILDYFTTHGFNFIDTADMYSYWVDGKGGGQSETILGNWMNVRNNRSEIVLATKVGGETGLHPADCSKKHILEAIDKSLERLQTDYIDLYYLHFDDKKTPVEETMEAFAEVVKAGKAKYIAASNISPERFEASMKYAKDNGLPQYVALQPHYNLVEREGYESTYAPLAEKYNLSVFPYWSLASGFLTGKYRSTDDLGKSVRGQAVEKYLTSKGLEVISALDKVADKHNSTPATVALAWLLAQPHIDAPIASATSESQLKTLFAAADLQLDTEDLEILDVASR